jgi:hypothetical protein
LIGINFGNHKLTAMPRQAIKRCAVGGAREIRYATCAIDKDHCA